MEFCGCGEGGAGGPALVPAHEHTLTPTVGAQVVEAAHPRYHPGLAPHGRAELPSGPPDSPPPTEDSPLPWHAGGSATRGEELLWLTYRGTGLQRRVQLQLTATYCCLSLIALLHHINFLSKLRNAPGPRWVRRRPLSNRAEDPKKCARRQEVSKNCAPLTLTSTQTVGSRLRCPGCRTKLAPGGTQMRGDWKRPAAMLAVGMLIGLQQA